MLFPATFGQPPIVELVKDESQQSQPFRPLKVGVVLSGGQAPGGHNVISGLFDALKAMNPDSELIAFRDGPAGITKNKYLRLSDSIINRYRNTGGFDICGSGRTKIETEVQLRDSKTTADAHDLDGLVVIGGDDSNTNAALIAEYFKVGAPSARLLLQFNEPACLADQTAESKCVVTGVPKTIDGDLSNEHIEISFGFDTACKVYANEVGNIARDAR